MNDDEKRLWRKSLGNVGERLVCTYLSHLGWKILKSKFHVGRSPEVDVIAINPDGITVFIEVKTRTMTAGFNESEWFYTVAQSINERKQSKIVSAARRFRSSTQGRFSQCRFDVILVGLSWQLATKLVRVSREDEENHLNEVFEEQINRFVSGNAQAQITVIHCEAAFVKNF